MDYVYARIASIRVDACTTEVKSCLTDDNRCGKDYSNCIGLDTDTIINMCPSDKLTACNTDANGNKLSQDKVYDNIEIIISGLLLNIDNALLAQCQNALNQAMINVCGDADTCENMAIDEGVGTRSFKYQVCAYNGITANDISWSGKCYESLDAIPLQELTNMPNGQGWAGKLSGLVYWGDIEYKLDEAQNKYRFTTLDEYVERLQAAGQNVKESEKKELGELVFYNEINALQTSFDRTISAIEADPKVAYCVTGRQVQGRGDKTIGQAGKARFPNLTRSVREQIALTALKKARENYNKKYDEEIERMMSDQVKAAKKMDAKVAQDAAYQGCADWAKNSALPASETPKASNVGKWIAVGVIAAVSVVASIFTFGGAAAAGGVAISTILGSAVLTGTAAVAAGTAVGAAVIAAAVDDTKAEGSGSVTSVAGTSSVDQWNYKMNVTTIFNASTGECTKVTITQNCNKTKKNYCKEWGDSVETTKTVNLL